MGAKFRDPGGGGPNAFLRKFEQIVADDHHDRHFNLEKMARAMDMSERQLQRKLKPLTGQTPSEFVRSYRLSSSLDLLQSGATVRDTAKAVGFSSQAYFASCFKAEYAMTPTRYRRRSHVRPR